MPVRDRTSGYMPGQGGVLGVDHTRSSAKQVMDDSRLFYVQPNHPKALDGGNTGQSQELPFLTVAAALALCRDNRGDVIFVGQNDGWQYGGGSEWDTVIAEEITISVEGVSLIGLNPGSMGVYWDPTTAAGTGTCITVTAMDVLIDGFSFFGNFAAGGTGIAVNRNGTTTWGDNITIRHCFFTDQVDVACITLTGVHSAHIHHCWFNEVDDWGIWGNGATEFSHIHDNDFLDAGSNGGAIWLPGEDNAYIHHNRIYNQDAENGVAGGGATNQGINLTGGSDNRVNENWFSCILTDTGVNGDWGDFNTGNAGTDAWVANRCTNGMAVTTPG